jgi:hypothetical protein
MKKWVGGWERAAAHYDGRCMASDTRPRVFVPRIIPEDGLKHEPLPSRVNPEVLQQR